MQFQPAIPTRGTKVPASPEWIHEIKYDGFRLIVHRDCDRVRLLTRNGHDWSGRYPLITCSKKSTSTLSAAPGGGDRSWSSTPDLTPATAHIMSTRRICCRCRSCRRGSST